MIIDKIERAKLYYNLNSHFQKVFEYINSCDLSSLEPGQYEIDGENSFLIIALDKPSEQKPSKLEVHKKYIDIQMAIEGSFGLTWKALEDCREVLSEYNPEIDATLYSDTADFEIMLNPGVFSILMPEDTHFPQPPNKNIKKAIVKVRV